MGYSSYYQVSSLRSGVTNYRDYAKQLHAVSRPTLPGVLRTWADFNYNMCLSKVSGNSVQVLTAFVATGITTGLTPVVLLVDGYNLLLTKNRASSFTIRVIGTLSTLNAGFCKEIRGVISIGATNASTVLLAPTVDIVILSSSVGLTAVATADIVNGALKITVTGAANESIRWIAQVEMLEIAIV
jgi:hypothetical protein